MPLLDPLPDETAIKYWQRQNEQDEKKLIATGSRREILQLYCQSCCYRYPDQCDSIDTLHPYDRAAEICADFIPKDYYKSIHKAKCWLKRLELEPSYEPLPTCILFHPYYRFLICDSGLYYKIMAKAKAYEFLRRQQNNVK